MCFAKIEKDLRQMATVKNLPEAFFFPEKSILLNPQGGPRLMGWRSLNAADSCGRLRIAGDSAYPQLTAALSDLHTTHTHTHTHHHVVTRR